MVVGELTSVPYTSSIYLSLYFIYDLFHILYLSFKLSCYKFIIVMPYILIYAGPRINVDKQVEIGWRRAAYSG